MTEIIKAITELNNYLHEKFKEKDNKYQDGWCVETNEQKIYVIIGSSDDCCAQHGYICSEDDPSQFIGAELHKIERVSTALNKTAWDKENPEGLDDGDAMFINFETNKGTFQLAVYNCHNGYYGNTASIISRDLNEEEIL